MTSAGLLAPSAFIRSSSPAGRDDVDLDAGVLGEGIEQRLDQLGFAIGVDVDLAVSADAGEAPNVARQSNAAVAGKTRKFIMKRPGKNGGDADFSSAVGAMPSATGCRECLDLERFQRSDLERLPKCDMLSWTACPPVTDKMTLASFMLGIQGVPGT